MSGPVTYDPEIATLSSVPKWFKERMLERPKGVRRIVFDLAVEERITLGATIGRVRWNGAGEETFEAPAGCEGVIATILDYADIEWRKLDKVSLTLLRLYNTQGDGPEMGHRGPRRGLVRSGQAKQAKAKVATKKSAPRKNVCAKKTPATAAKKTRATAAKKTS